MVSSLLHDLLHLVVVGPLAALLPIPVLLFLDTVLRLRYRSSIAYVRIVARLSILTIVSLVRGAAHALGWLVQIVQR